MYLRLGGLKTKFGKNSSANICTLLKKGRENYSLVSNEDIAKILTDSNSWIFEGITGELESF